MLYMVFEIAKDSDIRLTVESRVSLSSGSWNPFTNLTERVSSYEATISETPAGPSRFYRLIKAPCNCQ